MWHSPGVPAHCWVRLPVEPEPLPGLPLRWDRAEGTGWTGLVVVAVPGTLGTLLQLPADCLRPVAR